jgi:signal transduction histidine kinase
MFKNLRTKFLIVSGIVSGLISLFLYLYHTNYEYNNHLLTIGNKQEIVSNYILISLVVFLSGIWLAVLLSYITARKIHKITATINKSIKDYLPDKLVEIKWKNEFGQLLRSINILIAGLNESKSHATVLNKRLGDILSDSRKELSFEINKRTNAETALSQSEEQFRLLVELAPVGMVITSPDNIITKVNKAFSDMLGYETDQLIKMPIENITAKDDWAREIFLYKRLLTNKLDALTDWPETNEEDWENKLRLNKKILSENLSDIFFEKRFIQKNGNVVYGIVKSILLRDQRGKPLNFVSQVIDISDRKIVEKELIKAKDKAEESDRLKSAFLAQMSHEIRTPLNVILNVTPIIADELGVQKDEELNILMDSMNSAGKRLQRTIDLILNMASVQSGTYVADFEVINTAKQLESLIEEFKPLCYDKGLKLNFESCVNDPKISADEYTFTQIFQNLINNAIKYTPKGNISIKIYENDKDKICIEVKDTGIGISEKYLEKIFSPFSQEDVGQKREFEGNGLGLALVQKYIELNNADIKIESVKGAGSTFTVFFNKILPK